MAVVAPAVTAVEDAVVVAVSVGVERPPPKALDRNAPLFRVPRAAAALVMFRPPSARAEAEEAGVAAVEGETLLVSRWTLASARWREAQCPRSLRHPLLGVGVSA